jgi:hypothetical protein
MSNTLILNDETAQLPIGQLLKNVEGGVEVLDGSGNILAIVLSPTDHSAWTYAEANLDLDRHRDQVQAALSRRGGITTAQLLQKAAAPASETK